MRREVIMKYVKTAVLITAAISLTLFAACGGGGSSNKTPSVSVPTAAVNAYVGTPATIKVTAKNTDFTVSVSPTTGLSCVKTNSTTVTCTPTNIGTYAVTVTATADTSKHVSATVTVTNPLAQIATGGVHTMAILKDGSLWAWGANNYGQLGDGTYDDRNAPVLIYNGNYWNP